MPPEQFGAEAPSKLVPALAGGAIGGFLSAIPLVNLGCCLWTIIGGAVAGMMYIKRSPTQVQIGQGAIVGAIAGAIGWVIYLVIGIPLSFLFNSFSLPMSGEQQVGVGVGLLIAAIVMFVIMLLFTTIGGVLSVPIFEKRKEGVPGVTPPPPPQNFGGGGYR
jgi:hypothetical protein